MGVGRGDEIKHASIKRKNKKEENLEKEEEFGCFKKQSFESWGI